MMARSRSVMLLAALVAGAAMAPAAATAQGAALLIPAQFHPEIQGYQPAPRYYQPPPPRQVCWTENRRVLVGYDSFGRAMYRVVPRRVCGYR